MPTPSPAAVVAVVVRAPIMDASWTAEQESEEGPCDTDVQTLSDGAKKAHGAMLPNMLLL